MSLAMVSKASQMRASTVPLRSPSSIRRYCLPSRVLRISFSCTRKNEVMFCSVASSVTKDFFICNFSLGKRSLGRGRGWGRRGGRRRGRRRGGRIRRGTVARFFAKEAVLLVAFLGLRDFGRGADFLNFGVAAAGDVLVTGLDDHVALLAQRLQVFAHGRLKALVVKPFGNFVLNLVQRLLAFVVVLENLQDQKTLLGFHDVG